MTSISTELQTPLAQQPAPIDPLVPGRRHAGARAACLAAAAYVAIGFVLTWPVWRLGAATNMQADTDQWRFVWFFAWTLHAVEHAQNPFFTHAVNYPNGVNILLNTGQPLLGLLLSPVTALFGPTASYNVAVTFAPAVSALAAYFLLRRFTRWAPAAFIGGLLYGFGPYAMLHAAQVNLVVTPLVPLIFLALYHVVVLETGRGCRRWGVAMGLALAGQFFVSSEVLAEAVIVGVVAVVVAAAVCHREVQGRLRPAAVGSAWAAGVAVVLVAWPAWYLARGDGHVNGPVQLVLQAYRADLLAPVVPTVNQLVHVHSLLSMAGRFANGENGSYLGIPLLLLLLAGTVWQRRNRLVVVAGVTGVVAFVLSLGGALAVRSAPTLGPNGHAVGRLPLPEAVLAKLPLLDNLAPARFALFVTLCAAVVLAVVLDRLHERLLGRVGQHSAGPALAATWVPVAVAAVALLPLLPSGLLQVVGPDAPPAGFAAVAQGIPAGSTAVMVPFPNNSNGAVSMLWQALTGIRFDVPGGPFFVPQGPQHSVAWSPLLGYGFDSTSATLMSDLANGAVPPEDSRTRRELLGQWSRWDVRSVIAVPSATANPAGTLSFLDWLLGRPSVTTGATDGWYHLGSRR